MYELIGLALVIALGSHDCPFPCIGDNGSLSGPRVGVTVLTGSNARRAEDELGVAPVLTQFGWQFETELVRTTEGLTAVTELVPLVGGLEQGQVLPSLSWLVGLRSPRGVEFGIGPNLSLAGTGLVLVGGAVLGSGEIGFPVNLALVPSAGGVRISVLSGFVTRR